MSAMSEKCPKASGGKTGGLRQRRGSRAVGFIYKKGLLPRQTGGQSIHHQFDISYSS